MRLLDFLEKYPGFKVVIEQDGSSVKLVLHRPSMAVVDITVLTTNSMRDKKDRFKEISSRIKEEIKGLEGVLDLIENYQTITLEEKEYVIDSIEPENNDIIVIYKKKG